MTKLSAFSALFTIMLCCSCQNQTKPVIVPAVEVVKPGASGRGLEIIGGVEPVYFLPMKTPFDSRIDTGAETSSIDVSNMRFFERDGEKWVSFELNHGINSETYVFEKRIKRRTSIRRIGKDEQRVVVDMDIKMGDNLINAEFTLANRDKFTYQGLIGRNILNGRFLIDPSVENTLR